MRLKNANDQQAIYSSSSYGPVFGAGYDLCVEGSTVKLKSGQSYDRGPFRQRTCKYNIKEIEVFKVANNPTPPPNLTKKQSLPDNSVEKVAAVDMFSKKVNDAINEKWAKLQELEAEVLYLEQSFKDEEYFIESFGSGDTNNIIMLNVSGTMMATSRASLLLCEDSVLAQQFDASKWTEQGSSSTRVKDWTPDDVMNWVKSVRDVPDDIAALFWENKIKGSELLALNERGLEMIRVKRVGTICLLLKEIKLLDEASEDTATLIEYSPYCFGKILDYLRLKRLHGIGLIDKPSLPAVCETQKKRFEKVVKYHFPGTCSKFILG